MNLDETDADKPTPKPKPKKKMTRKEKKAAKKAPPPAAKAQPSKKSKPTSTAQAESKQPEVVDAKLDPSPVTPVPPPKYSTWEKISPPARRKKQITNMESGFREVLGLVQSMRNNQEVLLDAFQKLPEAVDSVKKLADHSAQQSDLLKAMNDQMGGSAAGEFNKTLSSMDQTTQLLLERAQRSEEKLYGILRQAQRRIAFMTLLVILLFIGALAAVMFIAFPEKTERILGGYSENPQEQVAPDTNAEINSEIDLETEVEEVEEISETEAVTEEIEEMAETEAIIEENEVMEAEEVISEVATQEVAEIEEATEEINEATVEDVIEEAVEAPVAETVEEIEETMNEAVAEPVAESIEEITETITEETEVMEDPIQIEEPQAEAELPTETTTEEVAPPSIPEALPTALPNPVQTETE